MEGGTQINVASLFLEGQLANELAIGSCAAVREWEEGRPRNIRGAEGNVSSEAARSSKHLRQHEKKRCDLP